MAVPDGLPWDVPAMTRRPEDAREAEFAALFEEFSSPIYNYVLRMVNDHDRAADITQDTFIKAYRKLDTVSRGNLDAIVALPHRHEHRDRRHAPPAQRDHHERRPADIREPR